LTVRATRLSDLLRGAGLAAAADAGADPEVLGASLDSRRVEPGHVFFALPGTTTHGVAFVPQALERGAVAVISDAERPAWLASEVAWVRVENPREATALLSRECHGRPDESLALVGITGTNGKTTVSHLVESIARAAGRRVGRIGTVGWAFDGVERPAERTTPEAPDLYRMLAAMLDAGIEIVSMEVSSHALSLARVAGARFATAAFLNLGRDHLDWHGTPDAYFEAKASLFDTLGDDRTAVLPAGDAWGDRIASRTRARILRFGRERSADVRLRDEHVGLEGSSAVLDTPYGALPVRSFLPGRFNLDNVAAAAACALALGLAPESIPAGVLRLERVPGRTERVDRGQPFAVVVDYAHTPEALGNLLGWTRDLARGAVRVVFGAGGGRDAGKRPLMGRVAADSGAVLYVTSDNPRDEDPQAILDAIARGAAAIPGALERCTILVDRAAAIRRAIGEAAPGDVVLIAGKGHETTQTIAGRVEPFDDRQVASAALEELGWRRGCLN